MIFTVTTKQFNFNFPPWGEFSLAPLAIAHPIRPNIFVILTLLILDNCTIKLHKSVKSLGVTFDQHFAFGLHINNVVM